MTLDSEEQRRALLNCIHVTASSVRIDASDDSLAGHAIIVQLRKDVETATITPAP